MPLIGRAYAYQHVPVTHTVGSRCTLDLQKKDGSRVQVILSRISTKKVFDVKVHYLP